MTDFHGKETVLIGAPTGRDADVLKQVFAASDFGVAVFSNPEALSREIERGAGVAVVTEEFFENNAGLELLIETLNRQPAWSDFLVLVLTSAAGKETRGWRLFQKLANCGDVVLMQRPVRSFALVSAVTVALRSRRRQYQLRDELEWRGRVENELRESEHLFRSLLDDLPLMVWLHDREGRQQFVNRTFCEFFGVTREEMGEERWKELVHPDDTAAYGDEFFACVRDRRAFHARVRVRRAGGDWRWMESWGRPRFDADGRYLGHIGSSADFTEARNAAEELRKAKETLEHRVRERTAELRRISRVFSGADDPMVLFDETDTVIDANREVEHLFGWSRRELIGQSVESFVPEERRRGMREIVERSRAGQKVRGIEGAIRSKSGETIPVLITLSKLSEEEDGAAVFVAIAKDIREIKETQQQLLESRALAETHRDIANMANTARSVEDALTFCLERVALYNHWVFGHAWLPSAKDPDRLLLGADHYAGEREQFRRFREATMALTVRRGLGLPGKAYAEGKLKWTSDLVRDLPLRWRVAQEIGVQTAVAFPVLVGKKVVGVLEFFSDSVIDVDARMEESMASIGAQMGRVIERSEAERALEEREDRLRQLTDQIRDVVWLRDLRTSRMLYCNAVFETVFGRSREIFDGDAEALLEFVRETDRERLRAAMKQMRDGGILEETYRFVLPDGSVRWFRERGYPILDAAGQVFRFAHVVEDITVRRQSEEALRRVDQRISEIAEEQNRRIAQDLHDSLGGLLFTIDIRQKIVADVFAEGLLPKPEAVEIVGRIIREAIMETRRLTRGLRPIGDDPENLVGALRDLTATIRAHSSMNCRFHCRGEIAFPNAKKANELFRIAQEATNNAVKHSGASHLTLALKNLGSSLVMTVKDNGIGIGSPKPFGGERGGFGLEIMKHRMSSVGGRLEIMERKKGGTQVVCTVSVAE